jgi:arylsulfatase A-like enzyme
MVCALLAGCGAAPAREVYWELVGDPGMEIDVELSGFRFADPWVHSLLLAGFVASPGYDWGRRPRCEFELWFADGAARVLDMNLKPYPAPDAIRDFTILLNGTAVRQVTLAPGWQRVLVELPERLVRPGANRVTIEAADAEQGLPRLDDAAGRMLIGLHELKVTGGALEPAVLTAPPWSVTGGGEGPEPGALRFEAPFQVDAWLQCPADAELSWSWKATGSPARSGARAPGRAVLALSIRPEGGEFEEFWRRSVSWGGGRSARGATTESLGRYADRRVQIRFSGGGERGSWPAGATLELTGVRLLAPRSSAPATPPTQSLPATTAEGARQQPSSGAPAVKNVLIYLVDALRADRLGCQGFPLPVSPTMDRLARQGMQFAAAFAATSWTRTSVATLLTGLNPARHGAITRDQDLHATVVNLAQMLAGRGFRTAAFITNGNVSVPGIHRGFEVFRHFKEDLDRLQIHQPAVTMNAQVLRWIDSLGEDPFFAYVHATDPHSPYTPPSPWDRFIEDGLAPVSARELRELYDSRRPLDPAFVRRAEALYLGEIRANDRALERLLRGLAARGRLDDTLVLLTADHGEEFGDHGGLEHGKTLFEEQLHVPLIALVPGDETALVGSSVGLVDVTPTILALLGIAPPGRLDGRPLPGLLTGSPTPASDGERPIIADLELDTSEQRALRQGRWKLVTYLRRERWDYRSWPRVQLFDLESSPEESRDLAAEHPVLAGYLRGRLLQLTARTAESAPEVELDEDQEEVLRALGYVR